ncbi:cytochrome P450 6d1 [Lucilia sericata]|uniref:cytochrome P450 6d1 n=1 Tax=Lucilia sericata TaxID=13632 RepID=UPI0018A84208|nr:cytochrome P450 6d1 [Lucilia sericata]
MLLFLLLIILTSVLYFLIRHHFSLWQRLGIEYDEPIIPYGCLLKVKRKERSFGLVLADLYEKYTKKFVGIYMFVKPAILLRDAALVRQIMTTDFASFHDRGVYVDEKNDPMSANLFTLKGQTWRSLRAKLTPSFTSGKLKGMFDTVDDVADKLVQHLKGQLVDGKAHTLEMKSLNTTYAIDIIGSVIFGLDIDSFTNPKNEFRQISDRLFASSGVLLNIRNVMSFVCPPIARFLSALGVRDDIIYSLRDIVKRTIEFREKHGVVRKDLLQLLIQLRNTGKISDDNDGLWQVETAAENLKSMSIEMIAAQSFLFYIAGSETTAATTSFTIYEFAMNPVIFKKAQTEIDECYKKHGLKPEDKLTYEAIQDMKYLDLCVMETTRKYPGLPFLNRECTQDFTVPGTNFTIKKGTGIIISLLGIHRDAEYFPNPIDYKPERFSEDVMDYNPVAFMPFGEGPRHCIAQRMGIINVKVALAKILANFNIEPMKRKEVEYKFHTSPVLVPVDGLKVALSKRW